ncbi:hypothetical protein BH11PSE13_BH11PSE13_35540 [soil metagenome]
MPALQISQSLLVNEGLSFQLAPDLKLAAVNDDATLASDDVLDSFKKIAIDSRFSVVDTGFAEIVATFTSPLELATFFINAKYTELGAAAGILGATASAVTAVAGTAGFSRQFQRGTIHWHAQVGAHELHGAIRVRWQELGGAQGLLGFPSSDVTAGADARSEGAFAHFQGGSIYWAPLPTRVTVSTTAAAVTASAANVLPNASVLSAPPAASVVSNNVSNVTRINKVVDDSLSTRIDATVVGGLQQLVETSAGAFEVHGAIREKYLALGAEASILGYPRTDESGTPDGFGKFNHFQVGSIYWTSATGAHEIHGLIRDRWASLGWERNAQLGYPISDELIPDERVGHRRPEARKKPILEMPNDVLKLPAEAASAGFPSSVVNTPTVRLAVTAAPVAPLAAATATVKSIGAVKQPLTAVSGAIGRLSVTGATGATGATAVTATTSVTAVTPAVSVTSDVALPLPSSRVSDVVSVINTIDIGAVIAGTLSTPASTPADARSVNRFADFESGVLFWVRGATSATTLSPLSATSDGTSLAFSATDVAALAVSKIGKANIESSNAALTSMTFVGTTGYSIDGVQVHNRRHRIQLILQGIENQSVGGFLGSVQVPSPVTAAVELQVEVWFDASQRRIVLAATDWTISHASTSSYADAVANALRAKLDPLLWTSFELLTLPDTNAGEPIAVLSVKTLANGAVAVFIEPKDNRLLGTFSEVANMVSPSVVLFAQPN